MMDITAAGRSVNPDKWAEEGAARESSGYHPPGSCDAGYGPPQPTVNLTISYRYESGAEFGVGFPAGQDVSVMAEKAARADMPKGATLLVVQWKTDDGRFGGRAF